MLVQFGTNEYWEREKEIKDWHLELTNGTNTKAERKDIIVIIEELKARLESDTVGKF